jgi:uncharacterized protein YbjQ (UPF0145 family)
LNAVIPPVTLAARTYGGRLPVDEAGVMEDDRLDEEAPADPVGARLERLRTGQAWTSLLSAGEFTAVSGAGFDPVGQVLGTAVVHLGYVSRAGKCSGSASYTPRTDLASVTGGPFNALLRKAYGVRRLALSRAVEECQALGGDGIVGVTLRIRPFPAGGTEFTLLGTAVRARTVTRPAAPFSSHLSGPEFARLLQAGWVPAGLVFGISLGARHDDARTRSQTRRLAGNGEVRGYADLVRDTRRDARDQLEQAVAAHGADGVVVDDMTLRISDRECPAVEGQHDHVAEVTILGTSVVSFDTPPAAGDRAPLTIMHLNPAAAAPAGPLAAWPGQAPPGDQPEESGPDPAPEGGLLDRYLSARAARRVTRSTFAASDPASTSRKA